MKNKFYLYAGFVAVCMMAVPYLILGMDAVVKFHDQLDSDLLAYILQAKYFGAKMLPEFMGGVVKTAVTPPAPFSVLFFFGGNYFAALILMQMIGSITGYVGIYLLAKTVSENRLAAAVAGVLFAYLPFSPVYGLSHFGIPLLFFFFLKMKDGKCLKSGWLYAVFFALNSSLVLVGFILLAFIPFGILYLWHKGGKVISRNIVSLLLAWGGMLLAYLLTNLNLIGQVLGLSSLPVSHKTDYIYQAEPFFRILFEGFMFGRDHSLSYHTYIVAAEAFILCLCFIKGLSSIFKRSKRQQNLFRWMIYLTMTNFILAFIAALWNGHPGIWLRTRMDILGSFQLTRVLWITPAIWYLILALLLSFVLESRLEIENSRQRAVSIFSISVVCLAIIFTAISILMAGYLKPNVQKLLNPGYPAISYSDYYALGVLSQVEEFIRAETGLNQADYRVVSLGINPAAALYNGFYCLDGYSNNYPLTHKHEFRKMIAAELDKNAGNKIYFDYWGNRCYILSAENDGVWPIRKGTFVYEDLSIDTDVLKSMGGKYLISAAYIENAAKTGLRLARPEPFETADSYTRLYLYEIDE